MLKLIIFVISVLIFSISYAAGTSCHDLQQSQLLSLNERMNKMIDTISALLPTSSKKPASLVTRALTPSADFTASSPGYESTYYTSPPAYTSPAPTPYIMYVSPPVTPIHKQSNSISTPPQYSKIEQDLLSEYAFASVSNPAPRRIRSQYQYEHYPQIQYQNSMPIAHSSPSSYPSIPYSFVQPTYATSCNPQYSSEYSYSTSRPNIPTYASGHSSLPLPVYMPPNTRMPTYPNQPELRSALYT